MYMQQVSVRLIVPNMSNFSVLVSHPIRPKAPSATSIPAILKSLQDEWVSVVDLVEVAKEKSATTHLHTDNVSQNSCFESGVRCF